MAVPPLKLPRSPTNHHSGSHSSRVQSAPSSRRSTSGISSQRGLDDNERRVIVPWTGVEPAPSAVHRLPTRKLESRRGGSRLGDAQGILFHAVRRIQVFFRDMLAKRRAQKLLNDLRIKRRAMEWSISMEILDLVIRRDLIPDLLIDVLLLEPVQTLPPSAAAEATAADTIFRELINEESRAVVVEIWFMSAQRG